MRHSSMDVLCPKHRQAFIDLATAMKAHGVHVFETYRGPDAQDRAFREGRSKARAGQSPHQYGMAVDYVPRRGLTGWHWPPADHSVWAVLRREAHARGLRNVLNWDRPHVECPCFVQMKAARRART